MKRTRLILSLAALFCLAASVAWASGGHDEPPNLMNLALRTVNLIIVVALFWRFAGAKVKGAFVGRQQSIENGLADLDERKQAAQKRLSEVEASIASLESEKAQILAEYKAQGEALKASIVAAAEAQAERIAAQAQASAALEAKAAVDTLRAEMAEKIVEAAEALLVAKLDDKTQDKLVDDALSKVVLN
ncbi:hypothetical protein JCM15519_28580 [Fundidesulfovibrio butyratiphilus]